MRIESASSINAPSSMRVRGWYLPACILFTDNTPGACGDCLSALPSVLTAGISAPSRASRPRPSRSEEHTSEHQSLLRISYDVFCLKKKTQYVTNNSKHS